MPKIAALMFPWRPSTPGRDDVVVVDVEGNGHQPPEIIEIAVLPISNGGIAIPAQLRTWLVRPQRPINPVVTRKVHGITDDDVADAPTWPQIAAQVAAELDGRVLVAHNASVERRVLAAHLPDWRPPLILDTQRLAKAVWPDLPGGYGLDNLITHAELTAPDTTGLPDPIVAGMRRHRAGYDTWMTAALLDRIINRHHVDVDEVLRVSRLPDPPAGPTAAGPSTPEDGLW